MAKSMLNPAAKKPKKRMVLDLTEDGNDAEPPGGASSDDELVCTLVKTPQDKNPPAEAKAKENVPPPASQPAKTAHKKNREILQMRNF